MHDSIRCSDRISSIAKATADATGNSLDLYTAEMRNIQSTASRRMHAVASDQKASEVEGQIREDVELLILRARAEAARWRAEARKKELEREVLQRRRAKQAREFEERRAKSDELIDLISDPSLRESAKQQQELLNVMHERSGEARITLETVEAADIHFHDLFARQSDAAARKVSRIRWEFSFSRLLKITFVFLASFCLLGLGVEMVIDLFHLESWALVIAFAAFAAGELFVARTAEQIDQRYCGWRLRSSIVCKVALFEATWRISEISIRALQEKGTQS
jgi:hypothetical protein